MPKFEQPPGMRPEEKPEEVEEKPEELEKEEEMKPEEKPTEEVEEEKAAPEEEPEEQPAEEVEKPEWHHNTERAENLLGELYNGMEVDDIFSYFKPEETEKMMDQLENDLSGISDKKEKNEIRRKWLDESAEKASETMSYVRKLKEKGEFSR